MSLTKVSYSMIDGAFINALDYGAIGDGIANNTTAIQAAIDAAAVEGKSVYVPAGRYIHTGTIVLKNSVNLFGEGDCHNPELAGFDKGTIFEYTGTNDGWQINNPINSSTPAMISVKGVTFYAPNVLVGKGAFADTGSTQLYFDLCSFVFNAAGVGLIFDQTEVSEVSRCQFLAVNSGTGACIWLVNGSSRIPGASLFYTNRITISNCQINPANTNCRGILDDGGVTHTFIDNNFNGGAVQIEASAVNGFVVTNNEMEGASAITCNITRGIYDQPTPSVNFSNNFIITDITGFNVAANTCDKVIYTNNLYDNAGMIQVDNILSLTSLVAYGNSNRGGGVKPINNYSTPITDATSNLTVVGETVAGSNSYTTRSITYSRSGDIVTFSAYIIVSTKDAAMSGNVRITGLPFPAKRLIFSGLSCQVVNGYTLPAGYSEIVASVGLEQTSIIFTTVGSGVVAARLDSANISNGFEIFINGSYFTS
jgi:hypothetical protein